MGNVVRAKDADRNVQFACQGVNKLSMRAECGEVLHFLYDTEDRLVEVINEEYDRYEFQLDA
jgi:hypothetical protein